MVLRLLGSEDELIPSSRNHPAVEGQGQMNRKAIHGSPHGQKPEPLPPSQAAGLPAPGASGEPSVLSATLRRGLTEGSQDRKSRHRPGDSHPRSEAPG